MAPIEPEFDKRNFGIIGLSVDPVEAANIEQGVAPGSPMIGDRRRGSNPSDRVDVLVNGGRRLGFR